MLLSRANVALPLAVCGALAFFWTTALVSDLFLDRPFVYTTSQEWSANLIRSVARFPGRAELSLHLVAAMVLVPAIVCLALFCGQRAGDPLELAGRKLGANGRNVALALSSIAALAAAVVAFLVLRQVHLIDDERAYAFEAELFARGQIKLGDVPAAFRNPMFLTSPWMAKYTPGQSLLLLPGALVGVPHLIPPLIAGALVFATYGFASEAYGERMALLAAALLTASPFVWCASGTLMAMPGTTCAMMASFWLFARARRLRCWRSFAGAGAFVGLTFLIRPFDAVTLGLPMAAWLLADLTGTAEQRSFGLVPFALGAVPFLALLLLFNWLALGSPFTMPYVAAGDYVFGFYVRPLPGIDYVHTPAQGIGGLTAALIRLDLWLLGWPCALVLIFASVFFIRSSWDRFLWSTIAVFALTHTVALSTGTWDVGPTYYLPIAPVLVIAAVRGLVAVREQLPATSLGRRALGWLPVAGTCVALLTVVPIRFVRLNVLAAEIAAPWKLVAESRLGDAIVMVPGFKQMEAPAYALGYPYQVPSGEGTAYLVRPQSAAELEEARRFLGARLPVYLLVFDRAEFEASGVRRYAIRRVA
jgi:hypothetical protein